MLKSTVTRLLLASCILALAGSQAFAAGPAKPLNSLKEKESYSIGYQVGRSMKTDGVEVDFDMLIQGLEDAINQKEPRLKDEEMRKLIVDLRKKAREAQLRKIQEQIVKNAQESEKFLEENKKKEGVKVTESGLQYKVLREGDGATPGAGGLCQGQLPGHVHRRQGIRQLLRERRAGKSPGRWRHQGLDRGIADDEGGLQVAAFRAPGAGLRKERSRPANPAEQGACFEMELLAVEKAADKAESRRQPQAAQTVRKMSITGEIGKAEHGYIIRSKKGNVLSEIYTILNPDPKVLDEFVKSEKTVPIEVRIVSGDNVNIEKIDGKKYR